MTRQLEVMHHDGTMTYWPLEEPGAHWKPDPLLGLVHYERGGSDRTHIPWQSIKYYHVVTRDDRAQKESDEQPTAYVFADGGAHLCYGREGSPCEFCSYPESSRHYRPEVGRPRDVHGDAAERERGAEGKPDAGPGGPIGCHRPVGDGV